MLYSVITTIQKPTASVLGLVEKLNEVGGKLIVAGDKKGPADFQPPGGESDHSKSNIPNPASPDAWPVEFFSLEDQLAMPFELVRLLPVGWSAPRKLNQKL